MDFYGEQKRVQLLLNKKLPPEEHQRQFLLGSELRRLSPLIGTLIQFPVLECNTLWNVSTLIDTYPQFFCNPNFAGYIGRRLLRNF